MSKAVRLTECVRIDDVEKGMDLNEADMISNIADGRVIVNLQDGAEE